MNKSKNFGQVVGMYVGTTAPENTLLIWYDSNASQKYHKIYDPSTNSWVALNPTVVTNITYSEIKTNATKNGLAVGKMYKLTDKSNVLAIAISSTKIQYVDTAGNFIVDDLTSSKIYHISSGNLQMDGLSGTFNEGTGKLNFPFNDTTPTYSTDYFLGKVKSGTSWVLAKFPFTKLISQSIGNVISWKNGLYFNFSEAIKGILDKDGGVVSKGTFEARADRLQDNLDNISKENQKIAQNAQEKLNAATTNDQIFAKQLPNAPTAGTPTDIVRGDTLTTIINKLQRYANRFKFANGIYLSSSYANAASAGEVNNNDSVQSAISKIMYYIKHPMTEIKVANDWVPQYGDNATKGELEEISGLAGADLTTVVDKFATWLLSTLFTTKIPEHWESASLEPDETVHTSQSWTGHNLLDVLKDIAYWLDGGGHTINLSDKYKTWSTLVEEPLPSAGENIDEAIAHLATKFMQLGVIKETTLDSKYGSQDGTPSVHFELDLSPLLRLTNSQNSTSSTYKYTQYEPGQIKLGTNDDSAASVSIKPNGSLFRHNNTVYVSEAGKYAGLGIVSRGTGESSDVALTAICTGAAVADAYFPRLMFGQQIMKYEYVDESDYAVVASSGSFVICNAHSSARNIWLPVNPPSGTVVYVCRASTQGCNVYCQSNSGDRIDVTNKSEQYISISERGRIYFFIYVSGISYSSDPEGTKGLWQFGFMNH